MREKGCLMSGAAARTGKERYQGKNKQLIERRMVGRLKNTENQNTENNVNNRCHK